MRHRMIGIVLYYGLQGVDRIAGFAAANLDITFEDQRVFVVWLCFQVLVVQLAGFIQTVFQDQQLNEVLLDHRVFVMVAIQNFILGRCLVDIAVVVVVIAQHAIAFGIIGEILFRLAKEFLGLLGLVLGHVQASQRESRIGVIRCGFNGFLEPLFGLGKSATGLVELAQVELRVDRFGIEFGSLLEACLRRVPLFAVDLEQTEVQKRIGPLGIKVDRFAHVCQRVRDVARSSIVVGSRDIKVGVRLFLRQDIQVIFGFVKLTSRNQQVG